MKNLAVILGIILVLLIIAFFGLNAYVYTEKQASPDVAESHEPYRGTLSGEYVCLSPENASGMQTDECTPGIQTDAGERYVLDYVLLPQAPPALSPGDRLRANGVITPVERLSTDHWLEFDVVGIFSATDSVEKI